MADVKTVEKKKYSRMDFTSDQSVRWCPGCGDYAILAQTQKVFPDLGIDRENIVFISGIGCSSRFPYYMNTFGFHTIHGRATAIASGVKIANPDLSVWVVTGDGDGLSIGGNHTIHLLRRNININVMLFNNRIYGLTKGQYSPTSEVGKITKSTPFGSLDRPFNPLTLAMGAQATFVARSVDRDTKHMQAMIERSHKHKGTSFLEIYQNCLIFNDGAFASMTNKESKADHVLHLEHGQPMLFGNENKKGIRLNDNVPEIIELGDTYSIDDVLIHNEQDYVIASMLANFTYLDIFPDPVGVLYAIDVPPYDELVVQQIDEAIGQHGTGSIKELLNSGNTWIVE
ncbi:MAG: 2-oxoacid:ferredoxin oxidoreductase subunit beta [Candidatus Marinimicrobia bacterium]|nr:2-oxoacid:ferredoxin oxidoreductase subunit beta [Candidatus Neomarinimicrobiota bacterium]